MPADPFDILPLLRADLPPPAVRWNGFPDFNLVGGHNDADSVPVDDLIEAATRVLITSGSLQGLDLVNGVLLAPGDTVVVEEMNYAGTLTRLKRCGANVVGVPLDRDGMRMDTLEATLADLARRGIRPKFIYTIPTVQNPTATVLTAERRARLLELARRYGVPISGCEPPGRWIRRASRRWRCRQARRSIPVQSG